MKFSRQIIILICMMFCSTAYAGQKAWYKDVSQAQADQDVNECKYEASKYSPPSDSIFSNNTGLAGAMFSGIQQGGRYAELYNMCMKSRGYVLVDPSEINPKSPPKEDAPDQDISGSNLLKKDYFNT